MDLELSTTREKLLSRLCSAVVQFDKLTNSESAFKSGQHTEHVRLDGLWLIRQFPEDLKDDLVAMVATQGVTLDLEVGGNEGNKP